jgi:DNA primase
MYYSKDEREHIIQELIIELHANYDGGRKNLLVPECPYCGKGGSKFGIYIGPETGRKKPFMSHCFKCGHTTKELPQLLKDIGRPDLIAEETTQIAPLEVSSFYSLNNDEEIDDELVIVNMPEGWKRCFQDKYLKCRGFVYDDYDYFPVGTTRGLNFKYDNYVLFPIIDSGDIVGYIGRHKWTKDAIDEYNDEARRKGRYEIRRYNNSTENDYVKLLYNYDAVIEDETDTVILCEGIFDVIALTRKLNLYDNHRIVPVATFGKKISQAQIFKLQSKGVSTIVVGYDSDATEAINRVAAELSEYFDVLIAKIDSDGKDWDEMDFWDIYDTFSTNLQTPTEFKLTTL